MKQQVRLVVEVCDLCGGEQPDYSLTACVVCGREYCLLCHAVVPNCRVPPKACRDCGKRADVTEVCDRYAKELGEVVGSRDSELRRLAREVPGDGQV